MATPQCSRKLLTLVFSPNHLQGLETGNIENIFHLFSSSVVNHVLFNSMFHPVTFSTNLFCRQAYEFSLLYQCSSSIMKNMHQDEGEHTCLQIQFKNLHKQYWKHCVVDLGSFLFTG